MYEVEHPFEGYYSSEVSIDDLDGEGSNHIELYRTSFIDENGMGFEVYETAEERAKYNRRTKMQRIEQPQPNRAAEWPRGEIVRTVADAAVETDAVVYEAKVVLNKVYPTSNHTAKSWKRK